MKTLSQISEDLYQLEQRMISGGERPVLDAYATLVQIRQDLEPHITSRAHATPGEGIEQKEGVHPPVVFLVWADFGFDDRQVVGAFYSREEAAGFSRRLVEHEAARPKPPVSDAPASNQSFFKTADRRWRHSHPSLEFSGAYSYEVEPVPVAPAALTGDQPPA